MGGGRLRERVYNTGLLILNSLKLEKLIFNFFVNRNWTKLTDSGKRDKTLANNRKSHHPIETLLRLHKELYSNNMELPME